MIDRSARPSIRCFGGAEELLPRRLFISLPINRTGWLQRERPAAAAERTAENKEPKLVRAGMTIAQKSKFIAKHGICRRRAANRRKQQRKQEAGTASPEGRYGIGDDAPAETALAAPAAVSPPRRGIREPEPVRPFKSFTGDESERAQFLRPPALPWEANP